MKKNIKPFAFIALTIMFGITSCKKDYTCTCLSYSNEFPKEVQFPKSTTYTITDTKSNAKKSCESKNNTNTHSTTTCTIN